ncbi:MAG: bifunctional DNase/RNase [Planctomycetota bacterium]|jgi:bifunctional DNase/RNase
MTPTPIEGDPVDEQKMVEIELGRIVLRDHSVAAPQHILLREIDGERSFPIVIGFPEASEIQRLVTGVKTERPMTHQLLHDTIVSLGARLATVDIIDIRHNTFYAKLMLENEAGEPVAVLDARPSDSIALALRAKCPLRISETVLDLVRTDESADKIEDESEESPPDSTPDMPSF